MIDLSYNDLANGLHVSLGANAVFLPVLKHWSHGQLYGSLGMLVFALIKEFWVDMIYEDKQTSGGFMGGCVDLAGYVIGILVANVLLLI